MQHLQQSAVGLIMSVHATMTREVAGQGTNPVPLFRYVEVRGSNLVGLARRENSTMKGSLFERFSRRIPWALYYTGNYLIERKRTTMTWRRRSIGQTLSLEAHVRETACHFCEPLRNPHTFCEPHWACFLSRSSAVFDYRSYGDNLDTR